MTAPDSLYEREKNTEQVINGLEHLLSPDKLFRHVSYEGTPERAIQEQRNNPDKEFLMYTRGNMTHYYIEEEKQKEPNTK